MGIPTKQSVDQRLANLKQDIELANNLIKQSGEQPELLLARRKLLDEQERLLAACSKCGGEKDSEGWCANYCTG